MTTVWLEKATGVKHLDPRCPILERAPIGGVENWTSVDPDKIEGVPCECYMRLRPPAE